MTIQELAKKAGVTTRTIRYYTEQGLLPAPERGRPARYTEEHLQRLELIRRLKEQYLPLDEIRDTLHRLTLPEVMGLLRETAPHRVAEPSVSSATDYIAGVLGRGAVREQLKQQAAPSYPPSPPPAYMQPPDPVAPVPAAPSIASPWPPAPAQAPGYAPPPAAMAPMAAPVPAGSMFAQADSSSDQEAAPSDGDAHAATTWHRVTLAPGMELHYLASGHARLHRLAARIAAAVKHILEESPDHPTEEP